MRPIFGEYRHLISEEIYHIICIRLMYLVSDEIYKISGGVGGVRDWISEKGRKY